MKQILILGSHIGRRGRRYKPDFIKEARANNNIFEVISYDITTNTAKIKRNVTQAGYWEHQLNTFDKIMPDRRLSSIMDDLDKYFEI